jgi:glucosyl-3-phosphoglycerate synthase
MGDYVGGFAPQDAVEWFGRRSYTHEEFADLGELGRRKEERGATISLVLPGRNVADTVGGIVRVVRDLNERMPGGDPLVDQILVVDADSEDGTAEVAREAGAEVHSENDLMAEYGGANGKGDAMWRSLSVATGDLIMFADADTRDFEPQFVYGTLGPALSVPGVRFVKGAFRRPFQQGEDFKPDGGGRVTELTTKPLFNLFYPELTGFVQPLAGEFVGDRELFGSIPFMTGYAVETGILIDVFKKIGLGAMAQTDLGTRQNRHQPLFDLSRMSFAVARAVARRLRQEGRLLDDRNPFMPDWLFQYSDYLHAVATPDGLRLDEHVADLVERPPMAEVLRVN